MFEQNSYQAYEEASLIGSSPARLVTALYKGAIDASVFAQRCFETGDVMGRSRAVTKVVNILSELMAALDHQTGGEMAANLKRLYSYMQQRALAGHTEKRPEPIAEVEKLLREMVEAWYKVAQSHGQDCTEVAEGELVREEMISNPSAANLSYGYNEETGESVLGKAYSF